MDQRQSSSQEGIAAGLHETADTARELAHTLEKGADTLETASSTARAVGQNVDRATDAVNGAREAVATRARERPLTAVAAAFAVGFVAGRLGG